MSQIAHKSSSVTPTSSGTPVKNLIINGNMDFNQRAVSGTLADNTQGYSTDRWLLVNDAVSNSMSYAASNLNDPVSSEFASEQSLILTRVSNGALTSGTDVSIHYRMEGLDYQAIHGQQVRLQFWMQSDETGTYSVSFLGAGGRYYTTQYSVPVATTWQKVTIDLTMDTAGGYSFDNTLGIDIVWNLTLGSAAGSGGTLNAWTTAAGTERANGDTNTWALSSGNGFSLGQVMLTLNPGGAATPNFPFQRAGATIAEELVLCQRYFEKSYSQNHYAGNTAQDDPIWQTGTPGTVNRIFAGVQLKTVKRVAPSVAWYSSSTGAANMVSVIVAGSQADHSLASAGNAADSNIMADIAVTLGFLNSAAVVLQFYADAEL